MHLRLEYAVDKAVSLCYLSAPTVLGLSFQGFGMPCFTQNSGHCLRKSTLLYKNPLSITSNAIYLDRDCF